MLIYIDGFIDDLLGYFEVVIYRYENLEKVVIFDLVKKWLN